MIGSIGKLIKLQDNIEIYRSLDNIIDDIYTKDIADIWQESEILYKSKDSINNLLDYLNIVFFNKLLNSKNKEFIIAIKIVENTKKRLASNANYDMCIDNLLLKIWEDFNENNCRS